MSVALLINSEDQLSSGLDWAVRFAESHDGVLRVAVLGADRTVLIKHTQSQLSQRVKDHVNVAGDVDSIEESVSELSQYGHHHDVRWFVLMHGIDRRESQHEIFQNVACGIVWLRPHGAPPINEEHVVTLFANGYRRASSACRELLGMSVVDAVFDSGERLAGSDGGVRPVENLSEDRLAELISITSQRMAQSDDLLVVSADDFKAKSAEYDLALGLIHGQVSTSVALLRRGPKVAASLVDRIRRWLNSITPAMSRQQRIELSADLESGSKPNWEYLGLISASSMLAAFGLLQNSAAVIIGAMLIAPLMTPILGAGMALSRGDRPLFKDAWLTVSIGFCGALLSSYLFGSLVLWFQLPESSGEMWSRCRPSPLDFCVGLVGGMAAAYARTRSHLSSALAGAAIAAALVPPISTAGLQLAFAQWQPTSEGIPVFGPLLLVTINVLTIMIGASFVLWARGIRVDRTFDRDDRWMLRMLIVLITLAMMILVGVIKPDLIFPIDQ